MADVNEVLAKYPVVVRQPVVWGDMDSYRHVNNVVYFRYLENARLEYFRRMGWFEFEDKTDIGPILAATSARFRRPLTFPDDIAIAARVTEIREDRFSLEHVIVSATQQAVVTEGTGLVVVYHYGESRKVPLPDELRAKMLQMESAVGNSVAP